MAEVTVCIAARNEQFLLPTIVDVLKNRRLDTEIIVVLDGAWPTEPIPDHPDVTLIYHPTSIGQRAAVNEAMRVSRAEFCLKLDAHCSVDEGFDAKLVEPYRTGELDRTATSIPAQHRLHVYSRLCAACGHDAGQGPMDVACEKCQAKASYKMEMVWKPRRTPSTSWVLNSDLHFCYDRKDKCRLNRGIHDVMTSLGAFWLMKRDRWIELGGLDERIGSWGAVGQEIAGKSWLSGGRHVCVTSTWISHYFRVGGIGFPYKISGADQERARKRSSNIWFNNAWPGQKLPLSFLVEKFWPISASEAPQWSDDARAKVLAAGRVFLGLKKNPAPVSQIVSSPVSLGVERGATIDDAGDGLRPILNGDGPDGNTPLAVVASSAEPVGSVDAGAHQTPSVTDAMLYEGMSVSTMRAPCFPGGWPVPAQDVFRDGDKTKMRGVHTPPDVTSVVYHSPLTVRPAMEWLSGNPREHDGVNETLRTTRPASGKPDASVAGVREVPRPQPASGVGVDPNLLEDPAKLLAVQGRNVENALSHDSASCAGLRLEAPACENHVGASLILPSLGIVYYTNHKLDPHIFNACKRQLARACNGHHVVSVSWEPMAFGENIVYKPGPSPHVNYFSQITLGLERLQTDYVAMCEHDVLYDPSHLTFRPPTDDAYWYNEHCWRVDAATGRAVTHSMRSVSGLVAYRELLLEHYRKMLAHVKAKGYWYKVGHEPGVFPGRAPGVDAFPAMGWRSWRPNADLRHGLNMTGSRWSPDKFTVPPSGWQESDGVPGWGRTLGRFDAWLEEVTR